MMSKKISKGDKMVAEIKKLSQQGMLTSQIARKMKINIHYVQAIRMMYDLKSQPNGLDVSGVRSIQSPMAKILRKKWKTFELHNYNEKKGTACIKFGK